MSGDALRITHLRTSCLLIEYGGKRALTDPFLFGTMRGLPVFRQPGIPPGRLGRLDYIFASHLHRDHYHLDSVRHLAHPALEVVGTRGTAARSAGLGLGPVHDLAPWESVTVGPFELTATPAEHTGPPPPEVNFIIDAGPWRVFFGGDARWSDAYGQIAERFDRIDVALLPIGGTLIFGTRTTMNPTDAARACDVLRPRWAVPIHEGGEWLPVPPASWHPGRNHHFVEALAESTGPTKPCVLAAGETATFTDDGFGRALYTPLQ